MSFACSVLPYVAYCLRHANAGVWSEGWRHFPNGSRGAFPGAKEPVRAYGRWEIEHKYSYKNGNGAPVTETKFFEIDSNFTHASCCYVQMADAR